MSDYEIRPANPPPASFTRRVRPGGAAVIAQGQIHATRGSTVNNKQVQATENWVANQPMRRGGWGSSADFALGPDHRIGDKIAIVRFGDWRRTYSSWSAGYGRSSVLEWGAAEVGVAIEVAQAARYDASLQRYVDGDSDVPFSDETIDALVWLCQHINGELEAMGHSPIPPVRIPSWGQRRRNPVPRGYIGHEDLANGVKLGKTDPGQEFPWDVFMAKLAGPDPEPEPAPPTLESGLYRITPIS